MPEKFSSMLRRAGKQMKQFNNENLTFIIQNFHRNSFIILKTIINKSEILRFLSGIFSKSYIHYSFLSLQNIFSTLQYLLFGIAQHQLILFRFDFSR